MLIELAEFSPRRCFSSASSKHCLTSAWQVSKSDSTATVRTLPPSVQNSFSCSGEMRPRG